MSAGFPGTTGAAAAVLERLGRRAEAFPGAVLLAGPSADRLEAEARRLAARLLCPNDCDGSCDACRRVASGAHPDLFIVEPEGVQIKIDRVRQALTFAAGRPYEAPRRVALVLGAERLGVEAANALLKSLEEPGAHLRWILTACRPESLLPTIRSRCATAVVPALSRSEKAVLWASRGFSASDAEDLALFAGEREEEAAARLEEYREFRARVVAALDSGLSGAGPASLLMIAEDVARAESPLGDVLADLLADAALVAAGSGDRVRHRAVAGALSELGRRRRSGAFRTAALAAADPPPDNRRGNRRLHFESALLGLFLAK